MLFRSYDSNGNLVLLVGNQSYTYNGSAQLIPTAGAAGYGTYYNLDSASLATLTGAGYTLGNFTGSLTGNATFSVVGGDSTTTTAGRDIVGNVNTLTSSLGYDLSFNNTPMNELTIAAAAPPPSPAPAPSSSGGAVMPVVSITPPVAPVATIPHIITPLPTALAQPATPVITASTPEPATFALPATFELTSQLPIIKSTNTRPVLIDDLTRDNQNMAALPQIKTEAQANIDVFNNGIITVDPTLAKELGLIKNEF